MISPRRVRFPLLLFISGLFANPALDTYNRLALSSGYLETVRNHALSDSALPFYYSLCEFEEAARKKDFLKFSGSDDSLTFNFSLAGTAVAGHGLSGYALSSQFLTYRSPHLRLDFRSDAYTTGGRRTLMLKSFETERIFSDQEHLAGLSKADLSVSEANLSLLFGNFTVSTGKEKLRWGPGYRGTLILSGTAPAPTFFYNAKAHLLNRMVYSTFLAGLDDEMLFARAWKNSVYRTSPDSTPPARYMAGHRLDYRFGPRFQAAFSEVALFYGSSDITRFINPVHPAYVGNLRSGTNNANLIMSIDYNVNLKPFRYYGELLNDDITVFDTSGNPDKFAIQQGLVRYFNGGPVKEMGFEYTHVHHYVYGHSRVLTRYEYRGEPLGWPYGNDQDLFALFARLTLLKEVLELKPELTVWNKGDGNLSDDWYLDGTPNNDNLPYWVKNAKLYFNPNLTATYEPSRLIRITGYYGLLSGNGRTDHNLQIQTVISIF